MSRNHHRNNFNLKQILAKHPTLATSSHEMKSLGSFLSAPTQRRTILKELRRADGDEPDVCPQIKPPLHIGEGGREVAQNRLPISRGHTTCSPQTYKIYMKKKDTSPCFSDAMPPDVLSSFLINSERNKTLFLPPPSLLRYSKRTKPIFKMSSFCIIINFNVCFP